ncbi:MAG: bacteriohemerythrin [Spirochaetales bacterium]|jgi:hemerythrin|nr:bacteriohemerythrin [Spirochaetales bacterium]
MATIEDGILEDGTLIEWDEKYSVGIERIDTQHRKLVDLTNTLYRGCLTGEEAARQYFMKTIQGTVDYVKYHFADEEKLMEYFKYPDISNHKSQHSGFVMKILEDVRNFQSGKKFVPNTFVRYLKDWILSHIAFMDKQYAQYILKSHPQKGKL